ncbi:MAG: hypothetical protein HYU69_16575 [Bacteroidetes bacterium]|nr:hypothetical protein [Bacteroidota bacterium]
MERALFFIIAILLTLYSYSCDCPPITRLSPESIKQYDAIFKGRVDSVSIKEDKDNIWFTIQDVFKGNLSAATAVYYNNKTSCEMKMNAGEEWLIYAEYVSFGKLEVNVCSRSRKYFADEASDYYVATNGIRYVDEIDFLKTNFGTKPFAENDPTKAIQIKRELIHPSQTQMVYWLIASLIGFIVIYYLFKRFVK